MINPSGWEMFFVLVFIVIASATAVLLILAHENVPWRIRQSFLRKFLTFWLGVSVVLMSKLRSHGMIVSHTPPSNFTKEWRLLSNGLFLPKNLPKEGRSNYASTVENPVIFILPTEYSAIQPALLTRIGQALYPARNFVLWVVVQLPLTSSPFKDQIINEKSDRIPFWKAVKDKENLAKLHLANVNSTISRFGIPYKLLDGHQSWNFSWSGHDLSESVPFPLAKGYLIGILWAVRNLHAGTIVLGDEQFVYNSDLFWELRKTKVASCWPIAFGSDKIRLSIPVATATEDRTFKRYYTDQTLYNLPIQRSGFAIDLKYLQQAVSYKNYWKLIYDQPFTNSDFSISKSQIQVIGKDGTEVYVWRILTQEIEWPTRLSTYKEPPLETNILPVLEKSFGPRFHLMSNFFRVAENITIYQDYDLEKHVKKFFR